MNSKMAGTGLATLLVAVALASPHVAAASPHRAACPQLSLAGSPESEHFPMTMRYACPVAGTVTLTICDPNGWPVRSLVDRPSETGAQVATWDGLDEQGHRVRGDAYLAVLRIGGRVVSRPFVLSHGCWKAPLSAESAMALGLRLD